MTEKEENQSYTKSAELSILDVVKKSHEEIEWVRTAYKFAVSIIAIIIITGLYVSYNSIRDFKTELRGEGKSIQKLIEADLSIRSSNLQSELHNEINRIRTEVSARIDDEFKKENITSLVTKQAQDRIDNIADNLIKEQITQQIKPLKDNLTTLISESSGDLATKMEQLDTEVRKSKATEIDLQDLLIDVNKTIADVKEQSNFVLTVLAAQSDDRLAFDLIRKWSVDPNYSLSKQAREVKVNILKSYSGFMSNKSYLNIEWSENVNPSELTFERIKKNWQTLPTCFARAYIEFVWQHENITKEEKLIFLYDALSDSNGSMQAANRAAKILSEEGKVNYNPPFNFSDIEEWWTKRNQTDNNLNNSTD